jgi:hypothetical protein
MGLPGRSIPIRVEPLRLPDPVPDYEPESVPEPAPPLEPATAPAE